MNWSTHEGFVSWIAVNEPGYSGAEVARHLGVTNSCVTRSLASGEKPDIEDVTGSCARSAVAVGMPVTPHPPHRSGLEELPHPAPTSGSNAQTLLCRDWLPPTDCLPYLISSLYKSKSECR